MYADVEDVKIPKVIYYRKNISAHLVNSTNLIFFAFKVCRIRRSATCGNVSGVERSPIIIRKKFDTRWPNFRRDQTNLTIEAGKH